MFQRQEASLCSKIEFQAMVKRVDSFTEIEHVNKLQNEYLPKIKKYVDKIDDFVHIVSQIRETVRHFDEDLCVKASKGEMLELKQFIMLRPWK